MTFNMKLVKKGKDVSRKGLLDQSGYHRVLERKYRGALQAAGWRPKDLAAFEDAIAVLESQMAEMIEARAESRENRKDEQAGIDGAKALKRRLVRAFLLLHQDELVRDADLRVIQRSGSLKRSTAAILDYLALIRGTVALYDVELRLFFNDASALSLLDEVKGRLESFQGIQEANLSALPQETLKVYQAKGELLSNIERMNHIGKIAFDGDATKIAEFNKDLLRRARATRAKSTVEAASDVPVACEEETG